MGINMDIRNEPNYSFLDLADLDEDNKNEIAEILRLDTNLASLKLPWDIGEKEYEITAEIVENPSEDANNQWQQYTMPEGVTTYETCEMQSSPMMTGPMTSAHSYPTHPAMVAYSVGDFAQMAIPYANSATGDPNNYPYGIPYGPPPGIYAPSQPEIMSQSSIRENDRHGGSRRNGGKRNNDSYNRQMNTNNEQIQTNYIVQAPPYQQVLSMCHNSGAIYTAQSQLSQVGTPIYIGQTAPGSPYNIPPQLHHNNAHQSYSHHQSSSASSSSSSSYPSHSTKYQRNSTGQTTYYNQESPKIIHKNHDKRMNQQRDLPPPFRHPSSKNNSNSNNNSSNNNSIVNNNSNNDGESPKRNYGKTLIVNNSNANIDTKNNALPLPPRQVENKKITIMNHAKPEIIQVPRIKDDSNEDKREKKEIMPISNADNNEAIVVKENIAILDKEVPIVREEKVSSTKPIVEISTKTVKIMENITVEPNEISITTKNVKEQSTSIKKQTVENSTTIVTTTVVTTNTSVNVPATPSTGSWAGLFKTNGPTDDTKSPTPITKLPMAFVRPINFPTAPVEPVNSKIASNEVVARQENVGIVANRNGTEGQTRNMENSSWSDNKTNVTDITQNSLNDPAVFRMGELLLKYEMDKQTVSLLPRGLTNRSNYCYINSILQALLACPPFYNLLMALPYPRNSMKNSSTPLIDNMVRFVREFNPLSEGARMPRKDKSQKRGDETAVDVQCGVAFEPSYVYTMLKNTSCAGVFSVEGRQEDAEEFLSCLLNGISDEMLELMKLVNPDSSDTTSNPTESNGNSSNADEGWVVMGAKNKGSITRCTVIARTPLSDIFRGQLRSRVSRTGDETTDNVQPFFTLQLDIEKAESVTAALDILVGKDQVEGMTCSKTKLQIEAWKQVMLEELPVILILHLKWFDYKLDGCSKIFKRVEFPINLMLDGKLLSSSNVAKKLTRKQRQYKLFAVTYHDGKEASKGHYVTDAFHVGYNAWVRYDDSSVKGIYEKDVLNPLPPRVPYLLYYRRCDTIGNNPTITNRTR